MRTGMRRIASNEGQQPSAAATLTVVAHEGKTVNGIGQIQSVTGSRPWLLKKLSAGVCAASGHLKNAEPQNVAQMATDSRPRNSTIFAPNGTITAFAASENLTEKNLLPITSYRWHVAGPTTLQTSSRYARAVTRRNMHGLWTTAQPSGGVTNQGCER